MSLTFADTARGTTYTDTRGTTWHAILNDNYQPRLVAAGNPDLHTYAEVNESWGPLVRSSFTAAELTTIADALATHHDEHEPLEGGPVAELRDRLAVLVKRAGYIESLLPTT